MLFKKLGNILNDIIEHPRTDIGHPEPMVGGSDMKYSRHITAHDRIIYEIDDEQIIVLIIEVEGHYDDK
ncbi:type II toxin-antitoxin system YoeB family toxin [Phocaeicola sp.]